MESEIVPSDIFKKYVRDTVALEQNKARSSSKVALVKRFWVVAQYDVCVVTSRAVTVALLNDSGIPHELAAGYDKLIQDATRRYSEGI